MCFMIESLFIHGRYSSCFGGMYHRILAAYCSSMTGPVVPAQRTPGDQPRAQAERRHTAETVSLHDLAPNMYIIYSLHSTSNLENKIHNYTQRIMFCTLVTTIHWFIC